MGPSRRNAANSCWPWWPPPRGWPWAARIPRTGDDDAELKIASKLVEAAGFEPAGVEPLARGKGFDIGAPVFRKALTTRELRRGLGLGS